MRLAALAALAFQPLASSASAEPVDPAGAIVGQALEQKANFCSAAVELKEFKGVPCTIYGDFTQKDLITAAKAVFSEAAADPAEQCAVAVTIFNRARADGKSLSSVVTSPGQFEGYSSSDKRECIKLRGAVAAVKTLAIGKSCSFGERRFKYFCSTAGWNRVKGKRKRGAETPEFIGETAFLVNGPC